LAIVGVGVATSAAVGVGVTTSVAVGVKSWPIKEFDVGVGGTGEQATTVAAKNPNEKRIGQVGIIP
jgi:hypothetical protein